jgi:hypothetical protein
MDWDFPFPPIFRLFAAENLSLRILSVALFHQFFRFEPRISRMNTDQEKQGSKLRLPVGRL